MSPASSPSISSIMCLIKTSYLWVHCPVHPGSGLMGINHSDLLWKEGSRRCCLVPDRENTSSSSSFFPLARGNFDLDSHKYRQCRVSAKIPQIRMNGHWEGKHWAPQWALRGEKAFQHHSRGQTYIIAHPVDGTSFCCPNFLCPHP